MDKYLSELATHPWAGWLLIALVSAIAEVALPYFTFIFVALAAAVAAVVAISAGVVVQVIAFALMLLVSLWLLRPRIMHSFRPRHAHKMDSRSEALVGMSGVLTEAIDPRVGTGRVLVNGQDWAAKARVPLGRESVVVVEGHEGIVLIVKEK